jgi:hypothetical protein
MPEGFLPQELAHRFLADISCSRDDARAELNRAHRPGRLPYALGLCVRKPFVDVGDGVLVPWSPWVVREQLRLAPWARLLAASNDLGGAVAREDWLRTFGDLFEGWCRFVGQATASSSTCNVRVDMPTQTGDDTEIEDVLLIGERDVALFSVKARLMREDVVKAARSRAEVLDWYESLLFAAPKGKYRAGAVRLLDRKISAIRRGAYEPQIRRDARVLPVLVTFEDLGENEALYRWIQTRCNADDLLQQANVVPLTLMHVHEYEATMAIAAAGGDVFGILGERADVNRAWERFELTRSRHVNDVGALRLDEIEKVFRSTTERTLERLRAAMPAADVLCGPTVSGGDDREQEHG